MSTSVRSLEIRTVPSGSAPLVGPGPLKHPEGALSDARFFDPGPMPSSMRAARRHWTQRTVIEAIQDRRSAGHSLKHNDVRKENNALLGAAYQKFGSWGEAVRAAGFEYLSRKRRSQD